MKPAPDIKIESGVPVSPKYHKSATESIRRTIMQMKHGDSFMYDGPIFSCYRVAKELGVHVVTRKINGCGRRVWRLENH